MVQMAFLCGLGFRCAFGGFRVSGFGFRLSGLAIAQSGRGLICRTRNPIQRAPLLFYVFAFYSPSTALQGSPKSVRATTPNYPEIKFEEVETLSPKPQTKC